MTSRIGSKYLTRVEAGVGGRGEEGGEGEEGEEREE